MTTVISIVLAFLLLAAGSGTLLYFLYIKYKAKIEATIEAQSSEADEQLKVVNEAIDKALERVSAMLQLSDLKKINQSIAERKKALDFELDKIKNSENRLGELRAQITEKETFQRKLRQSQEESRFLAADLNANNEKLLLDTKRLETALFDAKKQFDSFAVDADLSAKQKKNLENTSNSLEKVSEHLKNLSDLHQQSLSRFVSLDEQYRELENEFKRLIELELAA